MWLVRTGCVALILLAGTLSLADGPSLAAEPTAYDQRSGQWLFDPETIVSRNDVLYTHPSVELWEAMPVGGGDLSAMVYCSGANLDLHLTKSDSWGFQLPPEAAPGGRFFNNVSPGHVRLVLGPRAKSSGRRTVPPAIGSVPRTYCHRVGAAASGCDAQRLGAPSTQVPDRGRARSGAPARPARRGTHAMASLDESGDDVGHAGGCGNPPAAGATAPREHRHAGLF